MRKRGVIYITQWYIIASPLPPAPPHPSGVRGCDVVVRPSQVRHERNLPYEDYLRRGAPAPHLAASFTQAHACPRSAHPSITSAKQLLTHVRSRGDRPVLAARAGARTRPRTWVS